MSCYGHALKIYEREFGVDHADSIHIINMIGQVFYWQGEFGESLVHHKLALDMHINRFGAESADILNRMSGAYIAQGKYDEAIAVCKRAMTIHNTIPTNRAYALRNIGEAYILTNQFTLALPCLTRALHIYREQLGQFNLWTSRAITLLGKFYHFTNKLDSALEQFETAMDIVLDLYGDGHINTVITVEMYGDFLIDAQRIPEAINYLVQALAMYEKSIGKDNPRSIFARRSLGRAYAKNNKYHLSLSYYLQALKIIEHHYDLENNVERNIILNDLATISQYPDKDRARLFFNEACTMFAEVLGTEHALTKQIQGMNKGS
jgi:tetratricopeptide (TPR) repeat protein